MFSLCRIRSAVSSVLALSLCVGPAGASSLRADETPAAAAVEAPGEAEVSGRVYDSGGDDPVPGAVVRIRYLSDGREVTAEPSDGKGRFRIEGLDHGYVEMIVERDGARFVGSDVTALPPKGRVAVDLYLTRLEERSASWWESRPPLQLPDGQGQAVGLAEVRPELRGRDFWKSKKGIAVLAAVGGAALLAIVASSRKTPTNTP